MSLLFPYPECQPLPIHLPKTLFFLHPFLLAISFYGLNCHDFKNILISPDNPSKHHMESSSLGENP